MKDYQTENLILHFEWWGGECHPLEELIAEMDAVKKKQE